MRIGIDARLYCETGVGRYIENIISNLQDIDQENEYVLYIGAKEAKYCRITNSRFRIHEITVPWHSLREQFLMPYYYISDRVDLIHVPYFTIPIFFPGKIVVTMHDLILTHFVTGKASTLPPFYYSLKRIGYEVLLRTGLAKASMIIAVSHATKSDLMRTYGHEEKITVIHEGIDHVDRKDTALFDSKNTIGTNIKNFIKIPYFLYVGNAYPHKNLETLLESFALVLKSVKQPVRLALVGRNDFFYARVRMKVEQMGLSEYIYFFHDISDMELSVLYKNTRMTVALSLLEGFGFPVLESLVAGSRVLCSDIPVFHEVAGALPTFVNPSDRNEISRILLKSLSGSGTIPQEKDIRLLKKKFEWKTAAIKTKKVYEEVYSLSV